MSETQSYKKATVTQPLPILLENVIQLYEVEAAIEEAIAVLQGRIDNPNPCECDTRESLTRRLVALKRADEIIRRAGA